MSEWWAGRRKQLERELVAREAREKRAAYFYLVWRVFWLAAMFGVVAGWLLGGAR